MYSKRDNQKDREADIDRERRGNNRVNLTKYLLRWSRLTTTPDSRHIVDNSDSRELDVLLQDALTESGKDQGLVNKTW